MSKKPQPAAVPLDAPEIEEIHIAPATLDDVIEQPEIEPAVDPTDRLFESDYPGLVLFYAPGKSVRFVDGQLVAAPDHPAIAALRGCADVHEVSE